MKVDLRKWLRANRVYIAIWILMSLVTTWLVFHQLGITNALIVIVPTSPPFIVAVIRTIQELRK